jgi:hypothetical protein
MNPAHIEVFLTAALLGERDRQAHVLAQKLSQAGQPGNTEAVALAVIETFMNLVSAAANALAAIAVTNEAQARANQLQKGI